VSVISCENKDKPLELLLATKVTGAVPISTADVGDAVNAAPVPSRFVPVYQTLLAGIVPSVAVIAELCIVTVKLSPSISDMVNL